jgi:yeast amino acid transporter
MFTSGGFHRIDDRVSMDKVSLESATYEMTTPSSQLEEPTVEKTKKYGPTDLRRALSERHVNMIALSSTVGIGCFLQSGKVIHQAGPGGAIIAYLLMGTVVWSAIACLGEMTALFPIRQPIIDFPSRYIDESVGFATGWMAWLAFSFLIGVEISAVAELFQFGFSKEYLQSFDYPQETLQWSFGLDTNTAVWVGIVLVLIFLINLCPVRVYGEIEYVFGCIKIVFMVGLIMFNVIINAINVHQGRQSSAFANYNSPNGFFADKVTVTSGTTQHVFTGGTAHLVGIWSSMTTIFFGYQSMYTVSVTAAEAKNVSDETIKLATRKISLRVILLYTLLVFTVGLNVPASDPNLADTLIASIRSGQNSPFIIAMVHSHVTFLPHLTNAFFLFSAFSVSVNALFISSRLLHALANIRAVWPASGFGYIIKSRLEKTTRHGVPLPAICVTWLFGLFGFLGSSGSEPAKTLGRMSSYSSCTLMIVYATVSLAFLSFKRSLTVDGSEEDPVVLHRGGNAAGTALGGTVLNRNAAAYPYKSHLQYFRALYAFLGCTLTLFFAGWKSFLSPFSAPDFLATYMNVIVFVLLVSAYHIKDRQGWNPLRWERRVTMDINDPVVVKEKDWRKRRGRLHRADKGRVCGRDNVRRVGEFVWAWVK